MMMGVPLMKMKVVFEEVKFLRATSIQEGQDIAVTIAIHRASGNFEITEGKSAIAQGTIKAGDNVKMSEVLAPQVDEPNFMQEADFYKELRLRGYYHQGLFRAVKEIRDDGLQGKVKWNNEWTTFIDCLIQFFVLTKDTRMLVLPTSLRKIVIDPMLHQKILDESQGNEHLLQVESCPYQNVVKSGGVEVHDFGGSSVNRRRVRSNLVLEAHKFVSHYPRQTFTKLDVAKICVQIILENEPVKEFVCVELDSNDDKKPLCGYVNSGLEDLPVITPKINYLTSKPVEIENVTVQDSQLSSFMNASLIIKSCCANDEDFVSSAKSTLNGKGFIMSRELKVRTFFKF